MSILDNFLIQLLNKNNNDSVNPLLSFIRNNNSNSNISLLPNNNEINLGSNLIRPNNLLNNINLKNATGQPLSQESNLNVNPFDLMQSNDEILANASDYQNKVNNIVGNEASNQIDALIAQIQNQRANTKDDVGLGTKLLSASLGAIGGATGNQALQQQGFNILDSGRENLRRKKELLEQNEISLRTAKYQATLAEEVRQKNNYTDIQQTFIKYANQNANNRMSYLQQQELMKSEAAIKARERSDEYLNRLDLQQKQIAGEKDIAQSKLMMEYRERYGSEGIDMFYKTINGIPFTPEQENLIRKFSSTSLQDRAISVDEAKIHLARNESNGLNDGVIPSTPQGSFSGNFDKKLLAKNEQTFKLSGNLINNAYVGARNQITAELNKNAGGLKTGLGQEIDSAIAKSADSFNIPRDVFFSVLKQESANFNPKLFGSANKAFSSDDGRNATGISQITRDTAKTFGLDWNRLQKDPIYSIEAGAKIFGTLLAKNNGDVVKTLINYNAGSEMKIIDFNLPAGKYTIEYKGKILQKNIPSETKNYIAKINGFIDGYNKFTGENGKDEAVEQRKIASFAGDIELIQRKETEQLVPELDINGNTILIKQGIDVGKPQMRNKTEQEIATSVLTKAQRLATIYGIENTDYFDNYQRSSAQLAGIITSDSELIQEAKKEADLFIIGNGNDVDSFREIIRNDKRYSTEVKINLLDYINKLEDAIASGSVKINKSKSPLRNFNRMFQGK